MDLPVPFLGRVTEFGNLVLPCYSEMNIAFGHKTRNIGCGEENERQWMILDESNVQSIMAMELEIYAQLCANAQEGTSSKEEVETGLVQSSFCIC